jgi:hypothetical protein
MDDDERGFNVVEEMLNHLGHEVFISGGKGGRREFALIIEKNMEVTPFWLRLKS